MNDKELEKQVRPEVIEAIKKMKSIFHTLELIVSAAVILAIIQLSLCACAAFGWHFSPPPRP
jgi:hypothetical protein